MYYLLYIVSFEIHMFLISLIKGSLEKFVKFLDAKNADIKVVDYASNLKSNQLSYHQIKILRIYGRTSIEQSGV